MRSVALALLLVGPVLAGCLGVDIPWNDCPAPDLLTYQGGPALQLGHAVAPVLFWATNTAEATALLNTMPADAMLERTMDPGADGNSGQAGIRAPVVDVFAPNGTSFGGFWVRPTEAPTVRVDSLLATPPIDAVAQGTQVVACADAGTTSADVPVSWVEPGPAVQVGKGVLVHTVGLWENGTSFYTNDADYHEGPYPKGYDVSAFDGAPLPVYVYENDRSEMPPRYQRAGFFTTIPGFNEALKRMSVGTPALTYFPGEEGYTREGNEDHPLYGDDLIFYIEAVDVVDVPCEVPEPVCDVPAVPPPLTQGQTAHRRTHLEER